MAADERSPSTDRKRIRIGAVIGVHGLRGALRFKPDNPASECLVAGMRLWFERDNVVASYELVNVNPAGRGALKLTVAGIDRVEAAEALKGAAVSVDRECLPELGANEFYYFDMIGCEVVTTAGAPLGRIEEVFDNGAHDVIVVRDESEERMLPVIDSIVLELDLERRRVVVKPIPEMTD